MSTIPTRTLRPEINSVLKNLRTKIQVYLLFHGAALVLIALCASFLGTLAFDWIHFQIRKLELPVAFRVVLSVAVLGGICWVLANWLILRLLTSKKSHGLAMILERRFPDLDDRLITAVEFSDGRENLTHSPLSDAMVDYTVSTVASKTKELELGDVFAWKPLIVAWVVAIVMAGGTAATVAAAPQSFERWTRAFVYFDEVYWLRETKLEVIVLADPGDRPRPFVDGKYLHPRGSDLKLLVTVPDEERPFGGKWVTPEQAEIEYRFEPGGGGDSKILARRGDREFQFKMPALNDSLEFWISGNDYLNRTPYRIVIVDPPKHDSITLKGDSPDYAKNRLRKLIAFLKDLHAHQQTILNETVTLDKTSAGNVPVRELATKQDSRIQKRLEHLVTEGSPYVISKQIDNLLKDSSQVVELLERAQAGETTQKHEREIVNNLNIAIAILTKELKAQLQNFDERSLIDNQFDIPLETTFELDIRANKPLKNTTVQAGPYEFTLGQLADQQTDIARLRIYADGGSADTSEALPQEFINVALSQDRRTITLPFILSTRTREKIDESDAELSERIRKDLALGEEDPDPIEESAHFRLKKKWGKPWILPPDSQIKIYLEDSDGIVSAEPIKFALRGQIDQPPEIESETYGIGTSITRKASIPIKSRITDDFGIDEVKFQFKVDDAEGFRDRKLEHIPEFNPLSYEFYEVGPAEVTDENGNQSTVNRYQPYERFEVLRTGLVPGQKLTLTVYARDADNLNGPHESRGQQYTFKIVTDDELLDLLTEREINLRRQFEQIISEVERTEKDLFDHRELLNELNALKSSGSRTTDQENRIAEIEVLMSNAAERSLFQIGKNRAETAAIQAAFDMNLEELVNNKVHTEEMTRNLRQNIISPLELIVEGPQPNTEVWNKWNKHNDARLKWIMDGGTPPETNREDLENFKGNFPDTDSMVGLFKQRMDEGGDPERSLDESLKDISGMLVRMRQVLSEMKQLAELHEAISRLKKIADDFKEIRNQTDEERKNSLKNKLKDL